MLLLTMLTNVTMNHQQVNIRISMEQGIAGMVATTGQTLNIPDAYENASFNQTIDKKTGYRTKAILCMAIKSDDQVIGVLQLINKVSGSGVFTSDDEDVMAIFLAIAGPILAESNLYEQIQGKSKGRGIEGTGGEKELPGSSGGKQSDSASSKRTMAKFTEEDGDEED
jgi:signal transduction protein with GAF and PtsI domain